MESVYEIIIGGVMMNNVNNIIYETENKEMYNMNIRTVEANETVWCVLKDIMENLSRLHNGAIDQHDIKRLRMILEQINRQNDLIKLKAKVQFNRKSNPKARQTQVVWVIKSDLIPLIITQFTNKNKKYIYVPSEDDYLTSRPKQELKFLNALEDSLKPFNIKGIRQYRVLSYRIDYYIPELKIAIEYDESTHNGYNYEEQEGRQEIIEKELDCRFIRVSDKENDNYNIGLVIKGIFNL